MPRRTRPRYVVVTTAQDNGEQTVYGPWLDYGKAKKISDDIAATSAYYNGEEGIFDIQVQLASLDSWPGIRAFRRGE